MKKRIIIFLSFVCVLAIVGVAYFLTKDMFTPQKTHYHAGFVVFQNNKKVDFSDSKYMFIEPCNANETKQDSAADIQIEKAHLHENVGDLVHIERTGATWKDLFTNIKYPIDYTNATGYINGKQVADFQTQSIKPFDSLVVFIGKNNSQLLTQAVTKSYMEKMAKKSTTCGD